MSHSDEHPCDQTGYLVQRGLRAWTDGDLDALEALLDPGVTLAWTAPGEWDCNGRKQVMDLLRQRATEGRTVDLRRVERIDERTVVVSPVRPGQYGAAATRIAIAHGKVISMRQYASRDEALAAHPAG